MGHRRSAEGGAVTTCVTLILLGLAAGRASAGPRVIPMPARVGGTVTVAGVQLAPGAAARVVVTRADRTPYQPAAEDGDGLNDYAWYAVDVPIFDASTQPGGALEGENARVQLFLCGEQLVLTSPLGGAMTVGASGSASQVDLVSAGAATCDVDADGSCGAGDVAWLIAALHGATAPGPTDVDTNGTTDEQDLLSIVASAFWD